MLELGPVKAKQRRSCFAGFNKEQENRMAEELSKLVFLDFVRSHLDLNQGILLPQPDNLESVLKVVLASIQTSSREQARQAQRCLVATLPLGMNNAAQGVFDQLVEELGPQARLIVRSGRFVLHTMSAEPDAKELHQRYRRGLRRQRGLAAASDRYLAEVCSGACG